MSRNRVLPLMLLLVTFAGPRLRAQESSAPPLTSIDETSQAGEADALEPPRKLLPWNEFDWPVTTFRFGFGFLVDYANYAQDETNKQQVSLDEDVGLRDLRLLFRGKFKTKRPFSWTIGYMYDGADDEWRFRQTGVEIGIPEWHGRVFVGRTKEGYSMIKVMAGYHPWMIERSPTLDAFIPILADGVKWMGNYSHPSIFFSLGFFQDTQAEKEKFATYDRQIVARVGWRPILSEEDAQVLHLAVMARDARPDDGQFQARARAESYLGPYFIDTGKFAASEARTIGAEAFYRTGPWTFGGEYDWQYLNAAGSDNPTFHGGDVVATCMLTGEVRPYNEPGGFFGAISPTHSVFDGGKGAWEAVLHFSYADFDSGSFQGGKLWRFTPMVNWHLSDNVRWEFVLGYSELDRFGIKGNTTFFQSRLQFSL